MSENPTGADRPIITTVESPEPCRRVIRAEVARSVYDREYADRLKKAARTHQRPGFRKGHTPKAVVEREVGDLLRMEAIEAIVPKAWVSALLEHKLSPVTDPALGNLEFKDEGPLTFDLTVEVRPEITLGDLSGLSVRRRQVAVADDDVERVIERLREARAGWETVDREGRQGDQVTLDLVPGDDAGAFDESRLIADQRFVLGAEHNLPEFNERLDGSAAGNERIVEVSYPADHSNPALAGRAVKFRCLVKSVAQKQLPEVDDAFAAACGPVQDVAGLRADIRKDLEKDAARRVRQELDVQLQAELLKRHEVPLPASMVDKYLDSGLEELHQRNLRLGRPDSREQDAEYREQGRPHAERALRGLLLLEAVRRQEGIKADKEEVDERIAEIAAENGFEVDRYREFVDSGEERERIEFDLLERRTYDFLLSRAAVRDVPADTDVLSETEL
ncbi:MAG: trigger factor [bacterium]|nr:trigger factor [bacterium]